MLNVFIELNMVSDGAGIGLVMVDQKTRKKKVVDDYIISPEKPFSWYLKMAMQYAVDFGIKEDNYIRVILPDEKECKIFDSNKIHELGDNKFLKIIYVPTEIIKQNKFYREAEETALWISK